MPVLRETVQASQEGLKKNTIASARLLESLDDVHAGRRTQALAHDMHQALTEWCVSVKARGSLET